MTVFGPAAAFSERTLSAGQTRRFISTDSVFLALRKGCGAILCGEERIPLSEDTLYLIPAACPVALLSEEDLAYATLAFSVPESLPVTGVTPFFGGAALLPDDVGVLDAYEKNALIYLCLGHCFEEDPSSFETAKRRIETAYADIDDISDLAREMGFDRSYFTTKFTALYGVSPAARLADVRLTAALDLMRRCPGVPLATVALSVGYSDLPTFSKAFKRKYGASPLNYLER